MFQFRRMVLLAMVALVSVRTAEAQNANDPLPFPPLPEAISSFGAVVSGDHLYVFSGHMGRVQGNSSDGLSPHFCRLNVKQASAKWESLAMHVPSQSPGLVEWNGCVYRVGGLSFKNKLNEDTQFNSLAIFAKYDPKTNTWTDLPSLPKPRSSLDAAVVDGKLYVVGGWDLQAASAQEAPWHEDALVFDLSNEKGEWKPIAKPPFITRALAAFGHNHKLYVLGGMHNTNQITRDVHVFDPATNAWSQGPQLPGADTLSGFAISAVDIGGKLYFSGSEGIVYRLDDAANEWRTVERLLFPRSFHRLVAASPEKLLAVAGVARGGGYLGNVEAINTSHQSNQPKLVHWTVEFPGQAKHSQALLLSGSSLYAFGGNRSRQPHDFSKAAFLSEAFRFDLAARTAEQLPDLPAPLQSAAAYLAGGRNDQSIYVLGGLGPQDSDFRSLDTIFQYRLRSKAWSEEVRHLPESRAMFGTATHDGNLWVFGGNEVNTGSKGLSAATWMWNATSEEPIAAIEGASIPLPRRSLGSAVIGQKFYAVGGLSIDMQPVATTNVFDFSTRKWSEAPAPKHARVFPSLAAAGGKLYLAGGFEKVDGHFAPAKSIEVFDPEKQTWQTAFESAPWATLGGDQMAMVEFLDRLLLFGIDREKDGLAHFVLFDPNPATAGFGNAPSMFTERPGPPELLVSLLRLDKNKDGKLAKDEVGSRFQPIVDKVDADKDGFATKEEIEAYIRQEQASQPRTASAPPATSAGESRQGKTGAGGRAQP